MNPFQRPIGTKWPEAEAEANLPPEGVHISDAPDSSRAGRGSDDEYCSAAPVDGHHYVSHSVKVPPIRCVERCSLCGHISSKALAAELSKYALAEFDAGYQAGKRDALEPQGEPVRTLESHGVEDQIEPDTYWSKKVSCDAANKQHYMRSVKVNSDLVQYVERCVHCGWIDGASLNWWANNAIKMQLGARAQRIAVATESEPFSFAQSSTEELRLEEVLFQALGAASMCWDPKPSSQEFDSTRARAIGEALLREVQRFMRLEREDAASRGVAFLVGNITRSWMSAEQYAGELRKAIEGDA